MPTSARPRTDESSANQGSEITLLVERAKEGDRAAMNRLMGLFQADILRMVFYRVRSASDAEDLTQDILMQAVKHLPRLKQADRFRGWLYRIALNRVRDFYRKKRFTSLFGQFKEEAPPEAASQEGHHQSQVVERLVRGDFWKQVDRFMEHLSPMEQKVFTLRFFDQLSLKEISQALKKNQSTIKTHLYRGIKKFRSDPAMIGWLKEIGQ